MFSTPKSRGDLFLASSLRDGLEDNDLRQVETLLSVKDADPNVLIPNHGISPFHLVIGNESEEFAERVSKLFLRHGGDPNVKSAEGLTPVHVAAAWGRVRVLELLLANGGYPMSLDDEGRTPFHYAFDGGYHDAIAVLGKYCTKKRQIEENKPDELPKYKFTLDKILVNKGNVVAEYVTSDNSARNFLKSEPTDERLNETYQGSIFNDKERRFSRSPDDLKKSFNNVTLRRYHKRTSNLQFPIYSPGERSFDEEKLFVDKIIRRLSDTLADTSSEDEEEDTWIRKKAVGSGEAAKTWRKTPRRNFNVDTSIISKSPNCKIFAIGEKTPQAPGRTKTPASLKKNNSVQKSYSRSTTARQRAAECTGENGASSTPKRKALTRVRLYQSPQILNPKFTSNEKRHPKYINTVKLVNRMHAENPDIPSKDKIQHLRIYNDTKNEAPRNDRRELEADSRHGGESIIPNEKNEKNDEKILSSPGSSNPMSIYSLDQKFNSFSMDETQAAEEARILLEIEQAYKDKCPTPPASISFLETPEDYHVKKEISNSSDSSDESSWSACEYREAECGSTSSWLRSESFVSVDEEYTYEDEEEGVAFVERHLRVIPKSLQEEMNRAKEEDSWIDQLGELSIDSRRYSREWRTSSGSVLGTSTRIKDERELRDRLQALGEIPGPITPTTFDVYLKRLWRLERGRGKDEGKRGCEAKSGTTKMEECGLTVPKYLLVADWGSREDYYKHLEEEAFKEYSVANPTRKYRGGVSKSSFCYLLLDPRLSQDLPRSDADSKIEERWQRFLTAVFYVGKGKAARPAAHLYDAFNVWSKGENNEISRKIRRILEIWQSGQGVVCLHVFHHTMAEEACSREACMIEALGTKHLTNCVHGTYYGSALSAMNNQHKRSLGKFLLYRAMQILMHEGERQLFPRTVFH